MIPSNFVGLCESSQKLAEIAIFFHFSSPPLISSSSRILHTTTILVAVELLITPKLLLLHLAFFFRPFYLGILYHYDPFRLKKRMKIDDNKPVVAAAL